jgi:hypothetical protein
MHRQPVFLFSLHRSGSTLLERILNCHPNLVLWGEHGGIFNQLAAVDAATTPFPDLNHPLAERGLAQFIRNKPQPTFEPWRTPVSAEALRAAMRDWMVQTFTTGLAPEQRWGMKEIRYGGAPITQFLQTLFPQAQFLVLRRDLVSLCVSNILAPWSLDGLSTMGTFQNDAEAQTVVADCAYALTALDQRLDETVQQAGAAVLPLTANEIPLKIGEIFEFLALPLTQPLVASIAQVIHHRVGATDLSKSIGRLNRDSILTWAPRYLDLARREIARDGLDLARLQGREGRGQYCFVTGDHALRGSGRSSMGWGL